MLVSWWDGSYIFQQYSRFTGASTHILKSDRFSSMPGPLLVIKLLTGTIHLPLFEADEIFPTSIWLFPRGCANGKRKADCRFFENSLLRLACTVARHRIRMYDVLLDS